MFSRRFVFFLVFACIVLNLPCPASADDAAKQEALDKAKGYKPLRGIAFHFCSCSVPCPCMFGSEEDEDSCNLVRVFHLTAGGDAGAAAVGKTLVLVPRPKQPRNAEDKKEQNNDDTGMVLYASEELSEDQRRELMAQLNDLDVWIFGWNKLDIRPAKIVFRATDSGGYEIEIPTIFHAIAEPVLGQENKPITAQNLPLSEGKDWFIGKTKKHTYQDAKEQGFHWDLTGKNGSWTFFETHYIQR